jgi:hypothetical protein
MPLLRFNEREPTTPIETLHRILVEYGYCAESKAALGEFLRIGNNNVYSYLQPAEAPRRIRVRPETLQAWCWAIGETTGLAIVTLLGSDGSLTYEVTGFNAKDKPVKRTYYRTLYGDLDFSPNKLWEPEWQASKERGQDDEQGDGPTG